MNLPFLKLLGKKVIAKVASANLGIEAGSLRRRYFGLGSAAARFLRMTDRFIAITGEIEDGLKKDGFLSEKIERIPNFIDFTVFTPVASDSKNAVKRKIGVENFKIVTFSGRFIRRKGVGFLLEAWKHVSKEFPDARLLLLGDGPLLEEMKRMALELGIASSVDFRRHVNQIADFLHATDIFVFPSLQEGLPNSLLEAMACGLPVVATRIGGIMDIVKDGESGILVKSGDSNDLTEGLLRLLKDDEFAAHIASNAYKTIRNSYSIDSIAPRYIYLYRQLLRK